MVKKCQIQSIKAIFFLQIFTNATHQGITHTDKLGPILLPGPLTQEVKMLEI